MSKPSYAILLVEDESQKRLLYRYLRKTLQQRQIRIALSPPGRGSAEGWVRRQFPVEVNVYRSRRATTLLIVVIDADSHTVPYRREQLDQALSESNQYAVRQTEKIATLVARRNVETWVLCLNGETVNEQTDYKNRQVDWDAIIPLAAETLFNLSHSKSPLQGNMVDSLRNGIVELQRLSE